MNVDKQIIDLINSHLEQAKFHQEKADILRHYLGQPPAETLVVSEEIITPVQTSLLSIPKKNAQAKILFSRNPNIRTMKEWQELYSKLIHDETGKDDIMMTIRLLKMKGVTSKKDYGKNLVKWGLSEWYDNTIDDFKTEFK